MAGQAGQKSWMGKRVRRDVCSAAFIRDLLLIYSKRRVEFRGDIS
jgi:hypothetical protein